MFRAMPRGSRGWSSWRPWRAGSIELVRRRIAAGRRLGEDPIPETCQCCIENCGRVQSGNRRIVRTIILSAVSSESETPGATPTQWRDMPYPLISLFSMCCLWRYRDVGSGAEIDAGAQKIGRADGRGAVERAGIVAMGEVDPPQMIAGHGVAGANHENAAEKNTINRVAGDADIARLHVGIAVVHDDAEVAVGIAFEIDVFVQAGIAADFAIVETIEVETLAVDFLELIVAVDGTVDVAGGIDRDGERPVSRSTSSVG